jgi:hypothetical protein
MKTRGYIAGVYVEEGMKRWHQNRLELALLSLSAAFSFFIWRALAHLDFSILTTIFWAGLLIHGCKIATAPRRTVYTGKCLKTKQK